MAWKRDPTVEAPERADPERTFADIAINVAIDDFVDGLDAEHREVFNTSKDSRMLGDRVGAVCYSYTRGLREGVVSEAAVTLRSMHVVRYLDRIAIAKESQRDYKLAVMDPFWQRVDERSEQLFGRLAMELYDVQLAPVNRWLDPGQEKNDDTQVLGTFGGYRLMRRVLGWYGHADAVRYITER